MENENYVDYLSFMDIAKILKKRIVFIVIITAICTSIMAVKAVFFTTPIYRASTTAVIVKGDTSVGKNTQYTASDIALYQQAVETYAQIAKSNLVVEKVANELKIYTPGQLRSMVSIGSKGQTQIIELTVRSTNKNDLVNIANVYCNNFIQQSMKILPIGEIKVLDPADTVSSIYQNKLSFIAIGFLFGLILSIGITLLRHYVERNKIIDEKQVINTLNIPVLVTIE